MKRGLLVLSPLRGWRSPPPRKSRLRPAPIRSMSRSAQALQYFLHEGAEVTKPYLWPCARDRHLRYRAFPMEKIAEEEKGPKDHPHQRGIWFAHR